MNQLDDIALRRKELFKRVRNHVRFEHSVAADTELNELLPKVERAFNASVQRGVLPDIGEVLAEIEAGRVPAED